MPTITVIKSDLDRLSDHSYDLSELEKSLEVAKAEIQSEENGTLRIQLKDTNRPDLWSSEGLARLLKGYREQTHPDYTFFKATNADRELIVDANVQPVRPYIAAFACEGITVDEAALEQLIEAQEKLAEGYGRGRSAVAIGIYDATNIAYPVRYDAVDPATTTFVPLEFDTEMTLHQILEEHPTGRTYAHLLKGQGKFPLIRDSKGEVLSMPPIINSQTLGRVEVGDSYLFCEATGPELDAILLSMAIMATNMADRGGTIHPVVVKYPYDTPYGREITCPMDLTQPLTVNLSEIQRVIGTDITVSQIQLALQAMGYRHIDVQTETLNAQPPPYRDDILHPVDLIEDVIVAIGYETFEPEMPKDFTIGKAAPQEDLSDRFRHLMVGSGFQEIFLPILCSVEDQTTQMRTPDADIVQISNPMSENYSAVRVSLLPGLLQVESASRRAIYPHHIFEVGEVAVLSPEEDYGTRTEIHLGALEASDEANLSGIQSYLEVLAYYFGFEYTLHPIEHPTFLPGRAGEIQVHTIPFGLIGEVHPEVLETWGIAYPTSVFEINIQIAE